MLKSIKTLTTLVAIGMTLYAAHWCSSPPSCSPGTASNCSYIIENNHVQQTIYTGI